MTSSFGRDYPMILLIRVLHTAIYVIMVASIIYILFAGVANRYNPTVLYVSLGLVSTESIVFIANGWRCPLTTKAVKIAGREGQDYAPMIPQWLGRYTPTLFGSLFVLGVILLLARGWNHAILPDRLPSIHENVSPGPSSDH